MDNLVFNNDTRDINSMWYESHKNLIASICIDLGHQEKSEELVKKYLGEKVKIKKLRDPRKPKRSKSSYIFFCNKYRNDVMKKIKSKNDKFKIGNVQRILGSMWRDLTPEQKQPYIDESLEDKEVYKQKMEEYLNL